LARFPERPRTVLKRAVHHGKEHHTITRQQLASKNALTADADAWKRVDEKDGTTILSSELPLRAGVLEAGEKLISLNRPTTEDEPAALSRSTVEELFTGLDHQILEDTLETEKSLASEIWRTFLIAMALALLGEALLCMPARRTEAAVA
jgi:hypothetical protein